MLIAPSVLPAELLYATRTLVESHLAGCNALWQAAFDSSATLLDVHVKAARAQLAAANSASNQLLFVRDPQDLLDIAARQGQQAFDRAQRYGRQMAGVASHAHERLGELGKDIAGSSRHNPIE
ncbi:phasin protein [Pseudoduganella lurida]|uniref:Phasin protein n=1 Tax=Pseudoduganella lurida TaxID=1036180 RepID=A0A562R1L3_9BURK|nr:phasin family protein [Pseudoduganella lurida]TWI62959.1 phasin protein [Pseudoduganella lurida]